MPKHVENGQAVAEFLEKHDKVEFVNYPTLPSNKYYELQRNICQTVDAVLFPSN